MNINVWIYPIIDIFLAWFVIKSSSNVIIRRWSLHLGIHGEVMLLNKPKGWWRHVWWSIIWVRFCLNLVNCLDFALNDNHGVCCHICVCHCRLFVIFKQTRFSLTLRVKFVWIEASRTDLLILWAQRFLIHFHGGSSCVKTANWRLSASRAANRRIRTMRFGHGWAHAIKWRSTGHSWYFIGTFPLRNVSTRSETNTSTTDPAFDSILSKSFSLIDQYDGMFADVSSTFSQRLHKITSWRNAVLAAAASIWAKLSSLRRERCLIRILRRAWVVKSRFCILISWWHFRLWGNRAISRWGFRTSSCVVLLKEQVLTMPLVKSLSIHFRVNLWKLFILSWRWTAPFRILRRCFTFTRIPFISH